ncbi:MAG TPA: NAD(P)/FAD-dependent oxidoreductase, partial [Dehalococcoidia bacterium]|nr:NAD(P)/FAD-dependent oxidoreductase [Dehalococcoidia bacterium]
YWNRYPGARFDSESYSYAYSFSDELLEEWNWSEHFASQPEILRYLQYVASKFDLQKDIKFGSDVESALYLERHKSWKITLANGMVYTTRILVTAMGVLSEPTLPDIDGIDSFQGDSFHTARWPKNPVSFEGKDVAVIGTGASGVQTIQEIAKQVRHLTVFQRRPNWCAPLNNGSIASAEMREIKKNYRNMFARCAESHGGFIWTIDPRGTFEVTPEERNNFWETLYKGRGMNIYQGNFRDVLVDSRANKAMSDFMASKIRTRVNDPTIAELLIPNDHGFGTRRVPLETGYYETYNRSNVDLVDLNKTPIMKITRDGILTTDREHKADQIIYATGFNAITGSFDRINIQGVGGRSLKMQWDRKLETFLAVQVVNFPNLLMVMGPQGLGGNHPRNIEYNVEWITSLLVYMRSGNLMEVEPKSEAVQFWSAHIMEKSGSSLSNNVDSWMTGINSNVTGKDTRLIGARYGGSVQSYRGLCDSVASGAYKEMVFS